jgi:hypothetical protein
MIGFAKQSVFFATAGDIIGRRTKELEPLRGKPGAD